MDQYVGKKQFKFWYVYTANILYSSTIIIVF